MYDIQGTAELNSYLDKGGQNVVIDDVKSNMHVVEYSVSQESVMGPDIFSAIISQHLIQYLLYADGLQLYISLTPGSDKQFEMVSKNCIDAISMLMCASKSKLNLDKIEFVLFGNFTEEIVSQLFNSQRVQHQFQ